MEEIQYDYELQNYIKKYVQKNKKLPSFKSTVLIKRKSKKETHEGILSMTANGWISIYSPIVSWGRQLGAIRVNIKFLDSKMRIDLNTFNVEFKQEKDYKLFKRLLLPWQKPSKQITKTNGNIDFNCKNNVCVARNPYVAQTKLCFGGE